jgi:site-specific recombinase XerD
MTLLAPTLQAFFTDRLVRQRQASGHTITAYRTAWRLLLVYAAQRAGKPPARLDIADLDAPLITGFLDHLEHSRGNTSRTRNARLAAIHSLFSYAALRHPEHAAGIARVLAIPAKRCDSTVITYLSEPEVNALLSAPDPGTWTGRRDRALLHVAVTTGLRASELTGLTCGDAHLGPGAHVACHGKGRKDRVTPLAGDTAAILQAWLTERSGQPGQPVFCTRRGTAMSVDAIEDRVAAHAATAAITCPSLACKNVTPHMLRHTAAMRLLHAGVDVTVIALWLGHESATTTLIYLRADLELKQRALDRTTPPGGTPGRYQPPDEILAFLDSLKLSRTRRGHPVPATLSAPPPG